jgi:hypothetical protein
MPKRSPAKPKPAPKKPPVKVVPAVEPVQLAPKQIPWAAIAILLVGGYWVYAQQKKTPLVPVDTDIVTVNQAVKAVVDTATDKEAVKDLGRLYLAFGDVLSRCEEMPSSNLREWMLQSETFQLRGTDLAGKVAGFGDVKNAELEKILTLEKRQLTKADLAKVVAWCDSVAGACGVRK